MSSSTQRDLIMKLLAGAPRSTFDLQNHGICRPGARIHELRALGFKIDTVRNPPENDHAGYKHYGIAKYVLKQGVVNEKH